MAIDFFFSPAQTMKRKFAFNATEGALLHLKKMLLPWYEFCPSVEKLIWCFCDVN